VAETQNVISYSSDFVIDSRSDLSTLCVFYDSVHLPHISQSTLTVTERSLANLTDRLTKHHDKMDDTFIKETNDLISRNFFKRVSSWYSINTVLFRENVLVQMPAVSQIPDSKDPNEAYDLVDDLYVKLSDRYGEHCESFGLSRDFREEEVPYEFSMGGTITELQAMLNDVIISLARNDNEFPRFFGSYASENVREAVIYMQAEMALSYLLPSLSVLSPEEILEVRRKVADTREGFAFHLQKLSKGIDGRLKGGEDLSQIARWARDIVETELIPDYREFRRQIRAEQAGFWKKVLDPAGKILEINAAPWTPKFYGDLLKSLGFSALTYSAERKESLSNKSQAFQFMQAVEESKVAKYQRRTM
jgi:hypothetical protein